MHDAAGSIQSIGTAAAEKNGVDPIRRSHRIQERIFTARRSAATDIHATGRALWTDDDGAAGADLFIFCASNLKACDVL